MKRIVFDARALQDDEYSRRGIGLHASYILGLLRGLANTTISALVDPMLATLAPDLRVQFDGGLCWIDDLQGSIYINPSPLTHGTAPIITAKRNGLRAVAVVHDFIPMRSSDDSEGYGRASYLYLVDSLRHYDLFIANSEFTADEINRYLHAKNKLVLTVHCTSRFEASTPALKAPIEPGIVFRLLKDVRYVFAAVSDDPRKNPEIAMRCADALLTRGLRLAIGGA